MHQVLTNQVEADDMGIETARDLQCVLSPEVTTPAAVQMDENSFPVHDVASLGTMHSAPSRAHGVVRYALFRALWRARARPGTTRAAPIVRRRCPTQYVAT